MKVIVAGLGYVGTVTAACLAANGHEVCGIDVDAAKVDDVSAGRSPVAEPGLGALVAQAVADGKLYAAGSPYGAVDAAQVSVVCVGTPSAESGATDLTHVKRAVADIAAALRQARRPPERHLLVIRSTVPPGTADAVVTPVLAAGLAGTTIDAKVAMCPEFLREGTGIADFYAPPLLVAGTSDPSVSETLSGLFHFLDRPLQVVEPRVAETLKYACNAFHATKVSFANEIGRLCVRIGVDSREVMDLLCQDQVLNISSSYLRPGFAFGGSCLPKDLRSMLYLARTSSANLPLIQANLETNELSISEVVDRVIACDGQVVALLGLSFKMNTDDLRESPNVELAERLIGKGYEVRIHDQEINPARLVGANRRYVQSRLPHLARLLVLSPQEALAGADIAVVSTDQAAALSALLQSPPRHLIDLSGRLGSRVEALPGYQGLSW